MPNSNRLTNSSLIPMSLKNWNRVSSGAPRGAWTRIIDQTARPDRAFHSRNVRYGPGFARTRDGLVSAVAGLGAKVPSMYNWVGNSLNRLIYLEGTTAKMRNNATGASATLFAANAAARGLSVAEAADRAYIATHNTAGIGVDQVRISLPLVGSGEVDKAFPAPWTATLTMSDAGAGNVTAGSHKFGYIVGSRTGFTGKPSPAPLDTFTPATFVVAANGRKVNGAMTLNIPADASVVYPIMTTAEDPETFYFLPASATTAVPAGAVGWAVNLTYNISDESLVQQTAVDRYFDCLTQTVAGTTGPIHPHAVIAYGKRMAYLTPYIAYVSDIGDAQFITAYDIVELPGKRQIVTGFQHRSSLILLGPSWTYAVNDNGDEVNTWAHPVEISSRIGTTAVHGVCSRTAGDYRWVASEAGLFLFDGRYAEKPISYMNSDWWQRINWSASYSIKVVDDFVSQRVLVAVPLDSATELSKILVWDYSHGLDPMTVDFSYYDYSFGAFSSVEAVLSNTTNRTQLWIGPSAAGSILRESSDTWTDNGAAITTEYETGHLLKSPPTKFSRFGGADLGLTGLGTADVVAYGLDRLESVSAGPVTLYTAPGESPRELFDLTSESASIRIATNGVGEHFELTGVDAWTKPAWGHK